MDRARCPGARSLDPGGPRLRPASAARARAPESQRPQRPGAPGGFALGFGVAVANPTLILGWTAALTVLQAANLVEFSAANAAAFAVGTTLGIVTWSWILVRLVGRSQIGPAALGRLRRAAGYLVLGLCLVFLWRLAAALG